MQDSTQTTTADGSGQPHAAGEVPSVQIGPYTLLRPLGEGGMGVVYLARQTTPVERHVALKLIKRGMDTREVIARFDAERQALAVMNHPGIARVFDGGATDDGRPFFVMEHVDGEPITQFCDRARLRVTERIALIVSVCQAIQHAHQKGVIHRDLKPSNVLVTLQDGRPVPKIIDFGIAKAVHTPLTDRTFATQAGQWVGTPAYMSPEQLGLTGLDIDTRTDIYSLGVLLYELLVGARPYDEQKLATGLGLLEALRDEETPPPGTRLKGLSSGQQHAIADARQTEVPALHRALTSDLGWIIGKATEKDRTRRYDTVNGVAADLQRYLNNEPVLARPPSTAYRMRKFVTRHRAGVAGAAAVLALILASTVVIAIQAARVAAERDRAALEAARATSINQFLQDMLASADPWGQGSRTITVAQALSAAERRIETSLADQPDVARAVQRAIADGYTGVGAYEDAERLLAAAVESTRAYPERRKELIEMLTALGSISRRAGRPADGEAPQREAVDLAAGLGTSDSPALAGGARQALAETLRELGRHDEAVVVAADALELIVAAHGPGSIEAALAYETLSNVVVTTDSARAESLMRQVVDIRRQLRGPRHADFGLALSNLGTVLIQRGDFDGAVAILLEGVDILRAALGETDPMVAITTENLANALLRTGNIEESAARLEDVLAVRRKMLGDDSPAVGRTLHNLGVLHTRVRALDKADTTLAEARVRLEKALGPEHPEIAVVVRNQGRVREYQGDAAAAESLYRDALARNLRQVGENNATTAISVANLGNLLRAQRRYAEAETELIRARTIREQTLGPDAPATRTSIDDLVKLYDAWGRPEKAAAIVR